MSGTSSLNNNRASTAVLVKDKKPSFKETKRQRQHFAKVYKAEGSYARQLRKIARHVGELVKALQLDELGAVERLQEVLSRYSALIAPWARAVASRMLVDVSRRNEKAWMAHAGEIREGLRYEIRKTPTGAALRKLLDEQVTLITSLPIEAGRRVHRLATMAREDGTRTPELAAEIMKTGEVTVSRATLIARTEIARTSSVLTEVRSKEIGSDGYIWRTVMDESVRPIHRKLEGQYIAWDNPPVAGENGERAHAGQIYNCRCFPEPVLPESVH